MQPKKLELVDPEARLMREQRRLKRAGENRDVVVVSLAVTALLSSAVALAGWALYLGGAGCGGPR